MWLTTHTPNSEQKQDSPHCFCSLVIDTSSHQFEASVAVERFTQDVEIQIFTGAMWASFAAYLVGAAFADTQYELFPYFLVAYTTVLYHLACVLPNQVAS